MVAHGKQLQAHRRNDMANKSGINIDPKNEGKFTASAKRHGMGVQEFARHVLANKDKFSPLLVKRANFARNATKFKHGGKRSLMRKRA